MTRATNTILPALAVALAAHLALLAMAQRLARRDLGWWMPMIVLRLPPPAAAPPEIDIGEHQSKGLSINRAPGIQPLQATLSDARQEQAFMTRDQRGFDGGNPSEASALASALSTPANPLAAQEADDANAPGPKSPADKTNPSTQPTKEQQDQKTNSKAQNAQAAPQGKPVPSSDFESYPVATESAKIIDGEVVPRNGSQLKTRRMPDLGLAGTQDLISMGGAEVTVRLKIADDGNVVDSSTIKTSGDRNIDLPTERATATWQFEPYVDPITGVAHEQTVDMTIVYK